MAALDIQLAAAFRLSDSLVLILDAADGTIVDANPALERTLGWSRAELVGRRPLDLGLWPSVETRSLIWARLRGERRIVNEPLHFARRDGTRLAATLQCELIELDGRVLVLAIAQEAHVESAQGESADAAIDAKSYRSLFLAAREGIYRSLPTGGMIDVNPAFAQLFGYDTPETMLRDFHRVTRHLYVDAAHADRIYRDLYANGHIANERARVYRRDGSVIWISENARTVCDADGRLLFFEGSMVDITEQVNAEASLRQSEVLYRILVDNCRDGVFLIQRGKVVFTNGAMAAMLGYTVDELIGCNYMQLVAPESRDEQDRRRTEREAGSRAAQSYEIAMLRKDGTRRIVEVRADPVEFDGDIASTGTARDVTDERASQLALAEAERKFRKLFEHSVVGLFQSHPDGRILEANPAFARLLGYASPAELLASVAHAGDAYFDATERDRLMKKLADDGQFRDEEVRFRRRDGTTLWVSADARLVRSANGAIKHIEGSTQDITARRDAQSELRRSEERYRLLVEHSQAAVYVMRDDRYTYVNQMFVALSGYAEHELVGMHWRELATPEGLAIIDARLAARARGEAVPHDYETLLRRKDGRELRVNVSAGVFRLDDVDYFSGTLRDVTERHRFEQELEHNATHDALTQLPNRELFDQLMAQRLAAAHASQRYDYAMLFLDLDGFKLVNDSLGHAAGDRLLVAIAARLKAGFGADGVLSRYGGDEFAMLPSAACDIAGVESVARRLLAALAEPFEVDGHRIYTGASIGVVLGGEAYATPEQVLRDADTAMYRAKARGKSGYVVFDEAMHAEARARFALETDLRQALERGEFDVCYQPLVDLRSGDLVGCEALLRWRHPRRGLLLPPDFLSVAEETGLIVPIDWWMLERACTDVARWREKYPAFSHLRVNVNVDDRQFSERDVASGVGAALTRTGLAPSALALEVTETVFRAGRSKAETILREVKALGVSLVVDDFGTGYSSLDSFASSPFDALKIDRSFVRDMESNRRHRAIVRTIAAFAEDLGLSLTAEGVETNGQAELLIAMGVDTAQGFLYAPALSAPDMELVLAAGSGLKRRA
jgi:diguanylate cyclase (GGDEF)-like protein/PAS domain S-box-containing protein